MILLYFKKAENPVSKDHTATSNFFVSRDENKVNICFFFI